MVTHDCLGMILNLIASSVALAERKTFVIDGGGSEIIQVAKVLDLKSKFDVEKNVALFAGKTGGAGVKVQGEQNNDSRYREIYYF